MVFPVDMEKIMTHEFALNARNLVALAFLPVDAVIDALNDISDTGLYFYL